MGDKNFRRRRKMAECVSLPCSKSKKCIGEKCMHFVDLGLEGTDCALQLPKGSMDVIPGFVSPGTVFL